ncbi:hypothetical protein ABTX81_00300 [Kitasatospora sp. NPDC097605]|uniref:hypothetical protein n=1 Tax=Kitasatospora sp. NPDC097605 TaxID=3157226 RepID=UPI003328A92A
MTEPEFTARDARAREADGDREVAEDREVADELRVLLQLAAPHLAAPEDRMERVLARAARTRRRRRRAALAGGLAIGLTAAALAAAPALAPGPGGGTALHPAASGPVIGAAPPAGGSPSPSPAPVPEGGADDTRTVRFSTLDDLVVDAPGGWFDLTAPPGPGQPDPVGYLASQRISLSAGCPKRDAGPDAVCLTSGTLLDDGALVSLRLIRDQNDLGKYPGEAERLQAMPPEKECSVRGGTQQMRGHRTLLLGGQEEIIQLTGCLRLPSKATLMALETTIASIRPAWAALNKPLPSATPVTPLTGTK